MKRQIKAKKVIYSFFLIVIITIVHVGCQKESLTNKNAKELNDSSNYSAKRKTTIRCSPYRNLDNSNIPQNSTLANVVCQEINQFINCMGYTVCETKTSVYSQSVLFDLYGSDYAINDYSFCSISMQNDMLNQAKSYANMNTPSGYFVDQITIIPDYLLCINCNNSARISVKVKYSKCSTPSNN
jgi:hypothetical protein